MIIYLLEHKNVVRGWGLCLLKVGVPKKKFNCNSILKLTKFHTKWHSKLTHVQIKTATATNMWPKVQKKGKYRTVKVSKRS